MPRFAAKEKNDHHQDQADAQAAQKIRRNHCPVDRPDPHRASLSLIQEGQG